MLLVVAGPFWALLEASGGWLLETSAETSGTSGDFKRPPGRKVEEGWAELPLLPHVLNNPCCCSSSSPSCTALHIPIESTQST